MGHTWNFGKQNKMHNFYECPICMGPERLKKPKHPTQKPVKLLKQLINIASNKGDVILDPFMGVASTGVAALEMDRRFIGLEINDEEYFNAGSKRLENITQDMFTVLRKSVETSDIKSKVENDCEIAFKNLYLYLSVH